MMIFVLNCLTAGPPEDPEALVRATIGRRRRPGVGAVDCPICEAGLVTFGLRRNGTLVASCSTPGCVRIGNPGRGDPGPKPAGRWLERSQPRDEE